MSVIRDPSLALSNRATRSFRAGFRVKPGMTIKSRFYPLLLILFSLACFWPGQRSIPPIDRDESRFAETARQMAATGDLVDLRFQAAPRYNKPAGIYWLQAAAVKALGEDPADPSWPYRLPSLLGATGAVLATYALGKALLDRHSGFIAGLLLASSLLLNIEARLATAEAMLLCMTAIALAALARCYPLPSGRGNLIAFWLSLAAGILLKGPLILLVVGLTIAFAGQPRRLLQALQPAWGVPLLLAVAAPWFILITLRSGQEFWTASLGHDLGRKIVAAQERHGLWPGAYLLELPLACWPASPLVLAALPYAWVARRQPPMRFLLAIILPSWLVFELVPTKLPHYVLPLFPALAVLTAAALRDGSSRFWHGARRYQRWWLPGLAGLALMAYGIGFGLILPRLHSPFIIRDFVAHRRTYPAALQSGRVALAGFHEPSAVLWLGPRTELLSGPAAAAALAGGEVQLALVSADEQASFATGFTALDTLQGYDYASGHSIRLTVYRRPD